MGCHLQEEAKLQRWLETQVRSSVQSGFIDRRRRPPWPFQTQKPRRPRPEEALESSFPDRGQRLTSISEREREREREDRRERERANGTISVDSLSRKDVQTPSFSFQKRKRKQFVSFRFRFPIISSVLFKRFLFQKGSFQRKPSRRLTTPPLFSMMKISSTHLYGIFSSE